MADKTLKQKAQDILDEKEEKIIPENIKLGVNIFDITGTYEGDGEGASIHEGEIYQYININTQNLNTLATTYAQYISSLELDKAYIHTINYNVPTYNTEKNEYVSVMGFPRGGTINLFDIYPYVMHISRPIEDTLNVEDEYFVYFNPVYTNAFIQLDSTYGLGLVQSWLDMHSEETLDTLTTLNGWYKESENSSGILTPVNTSPDLHAVIVSKIDKILMQDLLLGNHNYINYIKLTDINEALEITYYTKESAQEELDNVNGFNNYDDLICIASGTHVLNVVERQTNPALEEHILDGYVAVCSTGLVEGTLTQNVTNTFNDTNAEAYSKIQKVYNNMTPLIATDNDKRAGLGMNIKIIPSKSDGTSLLDTSSVTTMESMFYNCSSLVSIPLFNTDNVTDMSQMFEGCTSLTVIPLFNTDNVTDMYSMFKDCSSLTTIPLLNTYNVSSMAEMFRGCTSIIVIPQLDTSNVTNMSNMFRDCISITTIPLLNTSNVDNIGQMFEGCTALISIPLLDTGNVINMTQMFRNCISITTIPLLDTSKVTGMDKMFSNCSSLSNESLNNILAMCSNSVVSSPLKKTLVNIGLTQEQAQICTSLSNYQTFIDAGWTTGY